MEVFETTCSICEAVSDLIRSGKYLRGFLYRLIRARSSIGQVKVDLRFLLNRPYPSVKPAPIEEILERLQFVEEYLTSTPLQDYNPLRWPAHQDEISHLIQECQRFRKLISRIIPLLDDPRYIRKR